MSGFSAEWLSLREPYDAASRNAALAEELVFHVAGLGSVSFTDFGCGTGANLRYTALRLPPNVAQRWRLIDHNPELLMAARTSLCKWADIATESDGGSISLSKDGRHIEVYFCQKDLASNLEAMIEPRGIAAASAFFDLTSAAWIARFVNAAATARAIVYGTLIYNGAETRQPPHPADLPMLAAFHTHQGRDKGFGRSSGPKAASVLEANLLQEGYILKEGDSTWRLQSGDRGIIEALAQGSANAVRELDLFDDSAIDDWRVSRERAETCTIGHVDILAVPPKSQIGSQ